MTEPGEKSGGTIETTGAAITPVSAPTGELGDAVTLPASSDSLAITASQRVARFTITSLLGSGGMGQVYAARDPELDRLVAIKLLRPELSIRADARLRREARAMARLSHPNLVTVHEVGVHDGQLFIAMELIDGRTLRQWARGRSWRDIVRVYLAAGRGLAAAHEAGIVHRDFKPDNVLVGDDGRVAVSDFGLAQTEAAETDEPTMIFDDHLTQAGTLLGTLRYMAPEQLDRRAADARSDQFAFCVSLWEALAAHPFEGARAPLPDAEARRDAMTAGIARPKLPGVPRRITRTLLRGLSLQTSARWPDMAAVLDQLDTALARRAQVAVGALVFGLIGIAVLATWLLRTPATDPCASVAEPITAIWNPAIANRLATAFDATGRPFAMYSANRVAELLNQRAAEWAELRIHTCVAAKDDQGAHADLRTRQLSCLDGELHELDALVSELVAKPSAVVVDRSIRVAVELPPVAACADVGALLDRPMPHDRELGARIDHLGESLAKAKIRDVLVGDDTDVGALEREAESLHWDPLIADIADLAATIAYRRNDLPLAETKYRQAAIAAARAHDDGLVALAETGIAGVVIEAGRPRDGLEIARAAEIASARAGDPAIVHADVESALGDAYLALSKFDDSDRAYAAAIAILETSGKSPFELAKTMNSWANQLYERSDYARAAPLSNKAVEMLRTQLGDHHPDLARVLQSNGNIQLEMQNYALARARFEEALAIKQSVYGATDTTVAFTLHSLGNLYSTTAEYARADDYYRKALAIFSAAGPDNANVLMARYSLATSLRLQGKTTEAITELEDVLARRLANPDVPPEKIANVLNALANAEGDLAHWARAIGYAERSLAIRDKVLGPEATDVADSLSSLATFWSESDACPKTRTAAARATEILAKQPGGDRSPMMATVWSALGACSKRDGKLADAIDDYRKGTALLADDRGSRAELDLALAELLWPSDHAAARAAAQDAIGGRGDWTARAKTWLAAHP